MLSSACCLCAQIAGDEPGDLLHRLLDDGSYRRRVVQLAGGLLAMPSVGALVSGHVLLCPADHLRSLRCCDDLPQAASVIASTRAALARWAQAPVQVFEHGDARHGTEVSCSVEHAHLHLLPGLPSLWPVLADQAPWRPLRAGLAELADVVGDREYVLYGDQAGRHWVTFEGPHGPLESQWLRRVAARAAGEPDGWNWREHPNRGRTLASLEAVEVALV